MLDINRYKKINSPDVLYDSIKIKTHVATPTQTDYKRGYITRYFIQKANDTESAIYEVDYIGFSKFIDNPFYTHVNLNWRIIGTDEQINAEELSSWTFEDAMAFVGADYAVAA